jgi:hypothetical protein
MICQICKLRIAITEPFYEHRTDKTKGCHVACVMMEHNAGRDVTKHPDDEAPKVLQ